MAVENKNGFNRSELWTFAYCRFYVPVYLFANGIFVLSNCDELRGAVGAKRETWLR